MILAVLQTDWTEASAIKVNVTQNWETTGVLITPVMRFRPKLCNRNPWNSLPLLQRQAFCMEMLAIDTVWYCMYLYVVHIIWLHMKQNNTICLKSFNQTWIIKAPFLSVSDLTSWSMVSTKQGTGWLIGVNRRPYYGTLATARNYPGRKQAWDWCVLKETSVSSQFSRFLVPHLPTTELDQLFGTHRENICRHFNLPGIRTDSERCPAIGWRPFKAWKIFGVDEVKVSRF